MTRSRSSRRRSLIHTNALSTENIQIDQVSFNNINVEQDHDYPSSSSERLSSLINRCRVHITRNRELLSSLAVTDPVVTNVIQQLDRVHHILPNLVFEPCMCLHRTVDNLLSLLAELDTLNGRVLAFLSGELNQPSEMTALLDSLLRLQYCDRDYQHHQMIFKIVHNLHS